MLWLLTFSPLFYGIRDVTNEVNSRIVLDNETFSPLFYGIRDVTHGYVSNMDGTKLIFQSPILRDS